MEKKLTLSRNDKKLAGVCAGVARYFNVDPTIVRILWLILALCFGTGVLAYLICWAVIPNE